MHVQEMHVVMTATRRDRAPEMKAVLDRIETEIIHEKRGAVAWLAQQLSLRKQAISRWSRVPIRRVTQVSALVGIPKHKLRPDLPDLFPPPVEGKKRKPKAPVS